MAWDCALIADDAHYFMTEYEKQGTVLYEYGKLNLLKRGWLRRWAIVIELCTENHFSDEKSPTAVLCSGERSPSTDEREDFGEQR